MRRFVWLIVSAVIVLTSGMSAAQPVDTSARAVVAKAAAHVKAYQEALEFVLADEVTTQEVFNANGARLAQRSTTGDFFLAYVAADGGWLSVRDILTVDGAPVPARDNVRQLLSRGSIARIGRQVADRNARYNLGSIARNFNDPMLALVILDDKHRSRFKFERRQVEQAPGATLVTVSFEERNEPTLVRGSDGRQIKSKGELVIDAVTGRLRRTLITLKDGATEASLTTVYAENDKLKLWLPSSLTERYEHKADRRYEKVVAESTYTNYRRFDVSVIIR